MAVRHLLNHGSNEAGWVHMASSYLYKQQKEREVVRERGRGEVTWRKGQLEGLKPFRVIGEVLGLKGTCNK